MFANIKKKSNKQFRKKVADDEETADKQPDQVATSTTSTNDTPVTSEVKQTEEDDEFEKKVKERAEKKKKIETTRKPTKSTALSFGDDEEPEDDSANFRITSSASVATEGKSKKKSRPLQNADIPTTAGLNALRNTSDYYTPENLEAMKKLQMNYNAPKKPVEQYPLDDEDRMDTDSVPPSEGIVLNAEQADALEDEEDEEIKRWEMEQIKKGGIQFQENDKVIHELEQHNQKIRKQRDLNKRMSSLPASSGPRPSLDDLVKKLKVSLSDLEDKHEIHVGQLQRVDQQIENSKSQLEIYDQQTKKIADQYVWYQGMRNYVADLCGCLAEKAPIIEECEDQIVKIEVERLERNANKLWFEQDDSKNSQEYLNSKENLLKRAESVFVDVNEEYTLLSTIKNYFEDWKKRDIASYRDAFCSLSMPQIFAPYVRLELLLWDPLVSPSFESQKWYQELFNYGIIGNRMEENDEDNNLVPKLVEKVVAAKLASFANNVWNPRTESQNRAMLAALDQILIYVEPHSEAVKDILTAVQVSLLNVIENMPLTIHDDALPDETERYLKLIKNTLAWEKFLSESVLNKIVLDNLINMRLSAWINRAKSKELAMTTAETILALVPKTWITGGKHGKLGLLHSTLLGLLKKIGPNDAGLLARMRAIMVQYNDKDIVQRIDSRKV